MSTFQVSEDTGEVASTAMEHAVTFPDSGEIPPRPAWVEVDLTAFAKNIRIIRSDLPPTVRLLYVLKDEAYGVGAVAAARVAMANGVDELAVYTLAEAIQLRCGGVREPVLMLGERTPEELSALPRHDLVPCIGTLDNARFWNELGRALGRSMPAHVKINTGMNRYGFSWREASHWVPELTKLAHIRWTGALTHFAQSDETDKTFARLQIQRFKEVVGRMHEAHLRPPVLHLCNSGGFLDLPEAHFNMVRVGLLALGVYPSNVCRRLPGLKPVLSVKAHVAAIQRLEKGDFVGYGMRYQAPSDRRIGVIPMGYGDGFPRVRNEGSVLVEGRRAPLVGGVTMDAMMVDLTEVPTAEVGSEVVLMGRQGAEEITVGELAQLKRSVSYDVLVGWRSRLPRRHREPTTSNLGTSTDGS